jgi:hypothetical protein
MPRCCHPGVAASISRVLCKDYVGDKVLCCAGPSIVPSVFYKVAADKFRDAAFRVNKFGNKFTLIEGHENNDPHDED